jgi:hypothetical protein
MTLRDYIETNKVNKNTFIAIHNKDDKWIIAGQPDDMRLQDYMTLNVISANPISRVVLVVQTDYDRDMQIAYYQMKAEQAEAAAIRPESRRTKSTSRRKKK